MPAAKNKTARPSSLPLPGDLPAKAELARMLRVDHAGEFGAQRIYAGQISVLGNSRLGDEIRHMAAQEDEHFEAFERLLPQERVRPTALRPIWHVVGFALGAVTARMGEQAAMACTVAVEEVIVEHYARQIERIRDTRPDIAKLLQKFKDEEDEHREIGLANDAELAPAYQLLRRVIRAGSKGAIWLSKRV